MMVVLIFLKNCETALLIALYISGADVFSCVTLSFCALNLTPLTPCVDGLNCFPSTQYSITTNISEIILSLKHLFYVCVKL